MKAVVMAVRPGEVVILDKDGCFRIVKDEGYAVGQILEVEPFTAFERHHTYTGNRFLINIAGAYGCGQPPPPPCSWSSAEVVLQQFSFRSVTLQLRLPLPLFTT